MSVRAWLLVAAAILLIGVGIALIVSLGACPDGGSYVEFDGGSGCFTSDVGTLPGP